MSEFYVDIIAQFFIMYCMPTGKNDLPSAITNKSCEGPRDKTLLEER
jgi:hypothetical protein